MIRGGSATIEATYRIVTPMFCSGADQQSAELRVPSFKGALRFWWRSLMWGKVKDSAGLRQKEAALFGASDQKSGQSRVQLRITEWSRERQVPKGDIFEGGRLLGAHYLGYGIMDARDGRLLRPMIQGGKFTVSCRFSRFASDEQIDEVRRALILLGTVGGLGSKARKGFGSLTLMSLTIDENRQPVSNSLTDLFQSVLRPLNDGLPEWTGWSRSSKIITYSTGQSANHLLNHLGRSLSGYRGWKGRDDSQFTNDHDLLHDYLASNRPPSRLPERIAFGLPHNYFFRSLSNPQLKKYVKAEVAPKPKKKHDTNALTRRGSPLFLHVHDTGDSPPTAVVAFLPSLFLPQDTQVAISDTSSGNGLNRRRHPQVTLDIVENGFWRPIEGFLQAIHADESAKSKEVPLG